MWRTGAYYVDRMRNDKSRRSAGRQATTLCGSSLEPHQLLADVAARQHIDKRSGSLLEAFRDRLVPFEAAGAVPCHQLAERLVSARQVVTDPEPLQSDAPVEEDCDISQTLPLTGVVL